MKLEFKGLNFIKLFHFNIEKNIPFWQFFFFNEEIIWYYQNSANFEIEQPINEWCIVMINGHTHIHPNTDRTLHVHQIQL